jgi:transcription elongation factor Elf1
MNDLPLDFTESKAPFMECPHCGQTFESVPAISMTADDNGVAVLTCDHCGRECYVELVERVTLVHLSRKRW